VKGRLIIFFPGGRGRTIKCKDRLQVLSKKNFPQTNTPAFFAPPSCKGWLMIFLPGEEEELEDLRPESKP
jgi:hypothetical protein